MNTILQPEEIAKLKQIMRRDSLPVEVAMVAGIFRRAFVNCHQRNDWLMPREMLCTIAAVSGGMKGVMTLAEEREASVLAASQSDPQEPELPELNEAEDIDDDPPFPPPPKPIRRRGWPRKDILAEAIAKEPPPDEIQPEGEGGSEEASKQRTKGQPVNVKIPGAGWKNAIYLGEGSKLGFIKVRVAGTDGKKKTIEVAEKNADFPDLSDDEFATVS